MMRIPDITQAEALLQWAEEQNPTFWATHSRIVAGAARTIAQAVGMDGNAAYVLGLLHDLGRYEGWTYMRHIYAGYKVLIDKGFVDAARICITHSFPLQDIGSYVGDNDQNDCTSDEYIIAKNVLENAVYDDYDRLIQLCDSIAGGTGVVLMEKRLISVALRYGTNPMTRAIWQELFNILQNFSDMVGTGGVYGLFPDAPANTFSQARP